MRPAPRSSAVVEADGDQPRGSLSPESELLGGDGEFLVHMGLLACLAVLREAGKEDQRPLLDRIANALLPSVARLQPVDVPPVRDPGGLQHLAHLVYPVRVLANVRNEYVLPTSVIHDRGV